MAEWRDLVRQGRARLIGSIRQEILSGVRHDRDFERLCHHLRDFDDVPVLTSDYEQAARLFNVCRSHGVTGSGVDLLMCAVAHRLGLSIFATDPDFRTYARHVPVTLHHVSRERQA